MPMKVFGADELKASLRNVGQKVPENARKVMHRAADKIVARAKLMCPIDLGNLEESIHQETRYEFRGRLTIDIIAGGDVNGVDVDVYASEIDENYSSMTPGPKTVAKQAANPDVIVGEHFIDRAVAEQDGKLQAALIEAAYETAAEEGL